MAPIETSCANLVAFTAEAKENDPDQSVAISYVPYIPFGASLAAQVTLSSTGTTASARFRWQTACPNDIGSHMFCFRATDSNTLAFGKRSATLCVVIVITQRAISISHVNPSTSPTLGNITATVVGAFLGNLLLSDRVTTFISQALSGSQVADSRCEATLWISMTSVACLTPRGEGLSLMIHHQSEDSFGVKSDTYLTRSFTYMSPTIVSISPHEATLLGNITVTVNGFNFGVGAAIQGSIGSTMCAANTYVSHTRFLCNVAPGSGAVNPVRLTVSRLTSLALSNAFTYSPPKLFFVEPSSNVNTRSGDRMLMYGVGFGIQDASPTSSCGATQNPANFWYSQSSMEFRAAAGVGAQILTSVTVDSQVGHAANAFAYRAPQISSAVRNRMPHFNRFGEITPGPTTGNVFLFIDGFFFGYFNPTSKARSGSSASGASNWFSDTSLSARLTSGSRPKVRVTASIACICTTPTCIRNAGNFSSGIGQTGFNSTDYAAPFAERLPNPFMPTSASFTVTVLGRNMGSSFGSDKVAFGRSDSSRSVWVSISSINSKFSSGCAAAHVVRISSDFLSANATSQTVLASFSAPLLANFALANSPRTASVISTLFGRNFNQYVSSQGCRLLRSSASFSNWVSESSLSLKFAAASEMSRFSSLTIALQRSSSSSAVSYDTPPVNATGSVFFSIASRPFSGSSIVSLHVATAALFDPSLAVRFVTSSVETTLWKSDSSCIAKFTAISRNTIDSARLSVGLRANASDFSTNSVIFLFRRSNSSATTGLQTVTVSGVGFGQVQCSGGARVRSSACESSLWVSDSSMRCRGMSGAALLVGGFVSVAKVASPSVSGVFSYSVHAVRSAGVATSGSGAGSAVIAASGALIVRVLGSGYSSVGLSQSARLRGSSCGQSLWLSDSDLRCRSAWGKDLSSYATEVVVSLAQQGCAMTNAISYGNVVPGTVSVDRVPTTGGSLVSVSGLNIGSFGTSARLQLQGTAFESSRWVSSSETVCRFPALGILRSRFIEVVASVANCMASNSAAFIFGEHSTSMLYPLANAAKSGSTSITVFGRGFGVVGDSPRSFLGVTECRTVWVSDSSFQLKSSMSAIPFSGIYFQSKDYSVMTQFDAVLSNLRLLDHTFSSFNRFVHKSSYWSEIFCGAAGIVNPSALAQVYSVARSIPVRWNSSRADQQILANLSISLLDPHNNLTILNLAVGHAIIRASSIISEIAYEEKSSRFCGFNALAFLGVIAEFSTSFADIDGRFFILNSPKMCSANFLQQSQVSYQILTCMQPALTPLMFLSLLTIAPHRSILQLSGAERHLGSIFTENQVKQMRAFFPSRS
jgi:hypothetical protein